MAESDLPTYTESWDASLNQTEYRELWGELGAFTTMRLDVKTTRCAYFIENHVERLCSTLKGMDIPSPFDHKWIWRQAIIFVAGVAQHGDYMFRMMATEDCFSLTAYPRVDPNFNISGLIWEYTRNNSQYKTLDNEDILEALEDIDRVSEELILQSEDGRLLEGATSNLIFVRGNRLYVPVADRLNGLTQQLILNQLSSQHDIVEEDIPASSLSNVDEIICCGSGKGVVCILSIPELDWEAKTNTIGKKTRFMYDSQLIDYKANWRGPKI